MYFGNNILSSSFSFFLIVHTTYIETIQQKNNVKKIYIEDKIQKKIKISKYIYIKKLNYILERKGKNIEIYIRIQVNIDTGKKIE